MMETCNVLSNTMINLPYMLLLLLFLTQFKTSVTKPLFLDFFRLNNLLLNFP